MARRQPLRSEQGLERLRLNEGKLHRLCRHRCRDGDGTQDLQRRRWRGRRRERCRECLRAREVAGRAAGVVSNVPVNHATPAAFSVHNESRNNLHALLESQIESDMDVIIGAGHQLYDDDGQLAATLIPTMSRVEQYERLSGGQTDWTFVEKGRF
ncbi:MAG: alkaline phosphatase [Tessaracoccus sp.]